MIEGPVSYERVRSAGSRAHWEDNKPGWSDGALENI